MVTCHVDMFTAFEKAGYKVTPIFAYSHKVDCNPYQPLPPTVANQIQTGNRSLLQHASSLWSRSLVLASPVRAIRATEAAATSTRAKPSKSALRIALKRPINSLLAWLLRRTPSLHLRLHAANHLDSKKMADETEKPDVPAQSQFLVAAAIAESCIAAGGFALAGALLGKQLYRRTAQGPLGHKVGEPVGEWRNWPPCRKRLPNDRRHPSRPGRELLLC